MQESVQISAKPQAVDVLVVGGGMSGLFAALSAKQSGMSVALIEPSNILGGQGTTGGVAGFCGDTELVNDNFKELVRRMTAHGLISPLNQNSDRRPYDLEGCGLILQEMVSEAGVDLYLHSRAIDASIEAGRVTRVVVTTACDLVAFMPKFVIDTSGSCVICKAVGLPLQHAPAMEQLPMGLYFTMWDTGKKVDPFLPPHCPTWDSEDDIPMTTLHPFESGKVEVKMKVVGFDASDGKSLSDAEVFARREMMGLIYFLQTHGYRGEKLDRHVLASVSRQIGIREANRIVGEHLLTEDEVTHSKVFDDAVAVGTYHLDYHWPDKPQRAGTGITTMVEPYHIPLRSLIPKGAKNILVPGRAASGDQMAMSSYRVMATCVQMGHAAGLTAAAAVKDGDGLVTVDIKQLQESIQGTGQPLDLSEYGGFLPGLIHQHEPIFEDGLFEQCHAPTLLQLRNNRYLAAWFAGSAEGNDDVRIHVSRRDDGRWTPPVAIKPVDQLPHWNPVLVQSDDGTISLFFKVGKQIKDWQTWRVVSTDEGDTWSDAEPLGEGPLGTHGPVKNKPIVLHDGTWLAPSSTENGPWRAFVDRSEDQGQTWQSSQPIGVDGGGVIQPTLWESRPGHVHMLLRSTIGKVCRSDSSDGGRTWCAVYPTALPNNNSGLDVVRLHDGTLALAHNPIEGTACDWSKRSPLSISISFDNGQTWPNRLDLETEPGEFSYPAIIATKTGMAVVYTHQRRNISFWLGGVGRIPPISSGREGSSAGEAVVMHEVSH